MARMGVAILVCVVVLALDVTAGILGIEAQAAQNKVMFQGIGFFVFLTENHRGVLKTKCFVVYGFASSCMAGNGILAQWSLRLSN